MARRSCISLLVLLVVLPPTTIFADGEACTSDDDCGTNEFCEFLSGSCLTAEPYGRCTYVPPGAGCPHVWMPVCGCDLQTYPNGCEATVAGVSILYPEACQPCSDAGACAVNRVCRRTSGGCASFTGVCVPVGILCPATCGQACACDGVTYQNACTVGLAALVVDHLGPCDDPADRLVTGVAFDEFDAMGWIEESGAAYYNVYRRVAAADAWSCFLPGVAGTTTNVSGEPAPGEVWHLQIAGVFGGVEGPLGVDTTCTAREPHDLCP